MGHRHYWKLLVSLSLLISFHSFATPIEIHSLPLASQENVLPKEMKTNSSNNDDCPPLPKKKLIHKKIYKASPLSQQSNIIKKKKIIHKKTQLTIPKCGNQFNDSNYGISNQLDDRINKNDNHSLNPNSQKMVTPEELKPMFEKPIEDPSNYYQTENMKKGIFKNPYPYYIPQPPINDPPYSPPKKPDDPATPVPEPSTYLLFLLGLLILWSLDLLKKMTKN